MYLGLISFWAPPGLVLPPSHPRTVGQDTATISPANPYRAPDIHCSHSHHACEQDRSCLRPSGRQAGKERVQEHAKGCTRVGGWGRLRGAAPWEFPGRNGVCSSQETGSGSRLGWEQSRRLKARGGRIRFLKHSHSHVGADGNWPGKATS